MAFAPDWNQLPALVVAVVTAAIALAVLRGSIRRAPNQFFAFFLLLVAANFGAQFLGAGFIEDPGQSLLWKRVGLLVLIWDPVVLVYFASVFPRRAFFAVHGWALALLALVPLLLTLAFFQSPGAFDPPGFQVQRVTLLVYLGAAYAYCLFTLFTPRAPAATPALARRTEFVLLGFAVALLPRLGLLVDDLGLFGLTSSPGRVAARIAITGGFFGALYVLAGRAARRPTPPTGPRRTWIFGWTAAFLAVLTLLWISGLLLAEEFQASRDFGINLYYPFRWILFSLIVGYAIVRYQVFDIELRLKRTLGLALFSAVAVSLFTLSYLALDRLLLPPLLDRTDVAAVLLAALLVLPFLLGRRQGTARLASLVFPHASRDPGYLRSRKLEVYAAHLEAAAAEGRLTNPPDPELEALRARLGLSPEEHRTLDRLVRRSEVRAPRLEDRIVSGEPLFGRYRILERLASGGFADIFAALDTEARGKVVLKRLHPRFVQDERIVKAFLREAEVAGRVRHPNIVPVREVLREGGDAYLVLDYVEGETLEEILLHSGRHDVSAAAEVARQLLLGLEAVHRAGVFHRDLKPANILRTRDGRVLISDFGVAHIPQLEQTLSGLTRPGSQPGTVAYMSPEQALGRPVDGRADLYAVGAILWELCMGRPLFEAKGVGDFELRQRVARGVPQSQVDRAPAELRLILRRALAPKAQARYGGPKEMLRDLNDRVPGPRRP